MIYWLVETVQLLLATIGCVVGVVAFICLIWFISTVLGKLLTKPDDKSS